MKTTGTALEIVRGFFPDVEFVVDATSAKDVEITEKNLRTSIPRSHVHCPVAAACNCPAVVSLMVAYLIYGVKAVRYIVPQKMRTQIRRVDDWRGFKPGIYKLMPPRHSEKLGEPHVARSHPGARNGTRPKRRLSVEVRASLSSGKRVFA